MLSFAPDSLEIYPVADRQGWTDEFAGTHGIKVVCFDWVQGFRHLFINKPIRKPEVAPMAYPGRGWCWASHAADLYCLDDPIQLFVENRA